MEGADPLLPPGRAHRGTGRFHAGHHRAAMDRAPAPPTGAHRGVPGRCRRGRSQGHPAEPSRRAGLLADDGVAASRCAGLDRGRLSSSRQAPPQPASRDRRLRAPGDLRVVRRRRPPAGDRRLRRDRRRHPPGACAPGGHPGGRRGEHAAAADAVGHRPRRAPRRARHPDRRRQSGRRVEPAGPPRRRDSRRPRTAARSSAPRRSESSPAISRRDAGC